MYQCCEHVSRAAQKRTRSIADYFSASTKGLPVEKRPRGEETCLWFDLLLACKLSRKVIFLGCWKSLSAASKCRKTHPCDYRISKFSGGACPRAPLEGKAQKALPILCPVVKLSCPPVENLNEPPEDIARNSWSLVLSDFPVNLMGYHPLTPHFSLLDSIIFTTWHYFLR